MATINDIFPGQAGRLQLIRVMIALRRPDLKKLRRDEPLPEKLEEQLLAALERIRRS